MILSSSIKCYKDRILTDSFSEWRSNQSILKEISPWCSLEGLMLKLKLQYFGHLMWRTDSFEKTLILGKIEGRRRRGWQRMRWLDGITNSINGHEFGWTPGVGDGQRGLVCCSSGGFKELDRTEQLNLTELNSTGPDAIILVFWLLNFRLTFSLSSFTFIKRLFRSPLHFLP